MAVAVLSVSGVNVRICLLAPGRLTRHVVLEVHPGCGKRKMSFKAGRCPPPGMCCTPHVVTHVLVHGYLGCPRAFAVVADAGTSPGGQSSCRPCFQWFGVCTHKWSVGSYGRSIFSFVEDPPYWSPRWLHRFASHRPRRFPFLRIPANTCCVPSLWV